MRFSTALLAFSVLWSCTGVSAQNAVVGSSSYTAPANFYGAHLLVDSGTGKGERHLTWARFLVGRWGYAKTLLMGVDKSSNGPSSGWVHYVRKCYDLELIPVLRLGGHMRGGGWVKPEADAPGDYTSLAKAVQRVVAGFPRSDKCPLYIELWNEPNLSVEWSGKPNAAEYAAFFVQAARAIREIGDPRIKILNGGLATSPEFAEELCKAEPDFIKLFDVWSSHPYPGNRPPWVLHHDKSAPAGSHGTIDSYLLELDILKKYGRPDVKVMITETGYDLGNSVQTRGEGHPIIDEYNRADYMVRAFRDYYPEWPELLAVLPFEFCNEGWERFDWVYPDSGTNPDGSPTKPHYQYVAIAALAKPTDPTGAISGTIRAAQIEARLEGAAVQAGAVRFNSDPMGNFFLPRLRPGNHTVRVRKPGFKPVSQQLQVAAGKNTVFDVELEPISLATLRGQVRAGENDDNLAGVKIRLEPGGQDVETNTSGEYVIQDVIPARYRLTAELDGHYRYATDGVEVLAGKANVWDFKLGRQPELPGNNMLNNASIEAGGGGGAKRGIALGFEPNNSEGGREDRTAISERIAHTGRRSQEMRARPEEAIIRQITHYGTARPKARYHAGIWVYADIADRDGSAWVSFDFTRNDGAVIQRLMAEPKLQGRSREWTWVSVEGVAPEGSERLSLNLHVKGRGGSAYFDDAFVAMIPAPEKEKK